MSKKNKFPKTLLAMKLDDGTIIVGEHVDEIGEDFDGDVVGVYELRTTGKFSVEKSINGKPPKKR